MKPEPHIVVLTGAGISAESGLLTFRDSGGLWEGYDINEVASIEGWRRDPKKVLRFYNMRRRQAFDVEPNNAHIKVAELQKDFRVSVITQNVDDLHERAGSENVIHLHGELTKACSEVDKSLSIEIGDKPINWGDKAPDGAQLRPDIVWFGEMVPMIEVAAGIMSQADILLVIGTSLAVYPATGLIHAAPDFAVKVLIDPNIPEFQSFDGWSIIQDKATTGIEVFIRNLKEGHYSGR